MTQSVPPELSSDIERAERLYRDALRMRDWCIGIERENGHLRWEIERIRRDFNSAVEDVRYHTTRADLAESDIERLRDSIPWKLGRALTYAPRQIIRSVRRLG